MIELQAGQARVVVDPARGARLHALSIAGHELLLTPTDDPLVGGCYPMVPWAGRIADGRFRFAGVDHRLPANLGDHAIHGTGFTAPWRVIDDGRFEMDLGPPWPYGGWVEATVDLGPDGLRLGLAVTALDTVMPVMVGWHPWFRRTVAGSDAVLRFDAAWMAERDDRHIPTGRHVAPPAGPWDDCFGGVDQPLVLEWPERVRLSLRSDCDHWVVYDEPADALCVEPQSGPPDVFNGPGPDREGLDVVAPGETFERWFLLEWATLSPEDS